MRNLARLFEDAPLVGRLKQQPSRYTLIRGFGKRGVAVRKRHGTAGGWVGFTMVAGGLGIAAEENIREMDLVGVGKVLIIVGAVVAAYAKLKVRTEENAAVFRTGYDLGVEDGDRNARKEMQPRAVLIDLEARRRCTCRPDKSKALTSAGNVVDRG